MKLQQKQMLCEIERDLQSLSRRRFLSMGGQALLFVGMGGISACSDAPEPTNSTISAKTQVFFEYLAQVLLPTEGSTLTPVSQVPLIQNMETLFSYMPAEVVKNLNMAISLFEYGGVVLGGHFSRFTKMDEHTARAYIDEWQSGHHVQQGIVTVLKKIVYGSYWQDETTWAPLKFDGPVSEKWGLPSLGETPLPQE